MLKSKVALVLGAGASKELNLPTGDELKDLICSDLNFEFADTAPGSSPTAGDIRLYHLLTRGQEDLGFANLDPNEIIKKARHLTEILPLAPSIDNFLDNFQDDPLLQVIGKTAIASNIVKAEASSRVYSQEVQGNQFGKNSVLGTWIAEFWKLLNENVTRKSLPEIFKNLTVISFNYDRCFQHTMFNLLRFYYSLSEKEAAEIANTMVVYHPYGSLGALEWQDSKSSELFPFGSKDLSPIIASRRIKTFTEQTHDPETIQLIQSAMKEADIHLYVGFAFHRQNLKLMKPSDGMSKATLLLGSVFKRSDSDISAIHDDLQRIFGKVFITDRGAIKLRNCTGFELIRQNARSLPAGS